MTKVFVSQPMTHRTEEEILKERSDLFKKFCEIMSNNGFDDFFVLVDNFIEGAENVNPLFCLGSSIEMLSKADVAVFAKGWENNRGCSIENICCEEYDIPTYYEDML